MEDLFSAIIVIIGIVASIVSSSKKAKAKQAAGDIHWPAPQQPKPADKKESHPYAPVQTMMPTLSVSEAPGQVIAPTVHVHVEPDCDTHDAPGSLGVISPEGKDPCHEEQMAPRHVFTEPEPEEGVLTFDWTGENMVKAFVMQEVLTRPANRRPLCQRQAQ